jgi:hypothetical protein
MGGNIMETDQAAIEAFATILRGILAQLSAGDRAFLRAAISGDMCDIAEEIIEGD